MGDTEITFPATEKDYDLLIAYHEKHGTSFRVFVEQAGKPWTEIFPAHQKLSFENAKTIWAKLEKGDSDDVANAAKVKYEELVNTTKINDPVLFGESASKSGFVGVDFKQLSDNLREADPNTEEYSYTELKHCIKTVETALRGTDWETALNEATRLCFSILWIGFVMAKHAHPSFPTMADWGVIARMRMPLLKERCLFENMNRNSGEPRWHPSCFGEGALMLGTGVDQKVLYVKSSSSKWVRVALELSESFVGILGDRLKKAQESQESSQEIDQNIWNLVGQNAQK